MANVSIHATPGGPLRRIRVVGCPGSGKTTFAKKLSGQLGLRHIELDEVFWAENWTQRDRAEALRTLAELTDPPVPGWVADGNWNNAMDGHPLDADTIVWLDYPRWLIMLRVIRRTVWRIITRQELWHGNRERLASILKRNPDDNIIRWAWTHYHSYQQRYADEAKRDSRVIRFRTPRLARLWLEQLSH